MSALPRTLEPPQVASIDHHSDFAHVAFTYDGSQEIASAFIQAAYQPRRMVEIEGRIIARISHAALGAAQVGDYIYPGKVLIFDYPAAEAPWPPTSLDGLAPWRAALDAALDAWQQDVRSAIYATPDAFIFSASPLQIIAVVPESKNPAPR